MPVGDVRRTGCQGAAIAQIAFLDAALFSANPRCALIPEGVFFGRHHGLNLVVGRIVALLGHGNRRTARQPVIGIGRHGIKIRRGFKSRNTDCPTAIAVFHGGIRALDALRLDGHDSRLPSVSKDHFAGSHQVDQFAEVAPKSAELAFFLLGNQELCCFLDGGGIRITRILDLQQTQFVHGQHGLTEGDQRVDVQASLALELGVEQRGPQRRFFGRDEVGAISDGVEVVDGRHHVQCRHGLVGVDLADDLRIGVPLRVSLGEAFGNTGPVRQCRGRDRRNEAGLYDRRKTLTDDFPAVICGRTRQ
ncbi:MAG: hypothetical protein ACD_54C00553G0001 [uncultured bacterium]|nr:MAG: hypothetical protein ACD_54C00553G0001 [uncultured bacterium]